MAMIDLMVMEIEDILNPPQNSNMAAMILDLDKLCNWGTPQADIHIYEVWALSAWWFWRRRFFKIFEKSKMAAKSCDLHPSNYGKKLPMTWGIFSESFMNLA